jgi:hypothetical protein
MLALFQTRNGLDSSIPTERIRTTHEFLMRDQINAELYFTMALSAMMTVSYRSRFWGFFLRSLVFEIFADRKPKRVEQFTERAAEVVHPAAAHAT